MNKLIIAIITIMIALNANITFAHPSEPITQVTTITTNDEVELATITNIVHHDTYATAELIFTSDHEHMQIKLHGNYPHAGMVTVDTGKMNLYQNNNKASYIPLD